MLLQPQMKTRLRNVHAQAIGSALERRRKERKHCEVDRLSNSASTIDRDREDVGS